MKAFVDTNVMVYAHDHGAGQKQQTARNLLLAYADDLVVSTQVLTEFYWVVTRKLTPSLNEAEALKATELLATLPVIDIRAQMVIDAIRTAQTSGLALWASLIIEAAASAGCDVVFTEDLNHGQEIRGIRIENPFL